MTTHDLIGVGVGPFNLGLAALAAPLNLEMSFLEEREDWSWHPGMMLPEATLQVPFLADLVTLADPTSPYSFLNYLKEHGHLYSFYIREEFAPLRREYDDYCRWVAYQLGDRIRFGHRVDRIEHDGSAYVVLAGGSEFRTRRLALGVGTAPRRPDAAAALDGVAEVIHSADYLPHRRDLLTKDSITVVGSGQSAAEVFLDLLNRQDGHDLRWVTRSPRFLPMEYTKLTLELTSPEYTAYFQELAPQTRAELLAGQRGLYKGISSATIAAIFDALYARRVSGGSGEVTLLTASEVTGSVPGPPHRLNLRHLETGTDFALTSAAIVFATGYAGAVPEFIEPIRDRLRFDEQGRFAATGDYAIDHTGQEVFVQNAEEHTHGFVAPDLGLGAYRNSRILAAITGREVYGMEKRIAFQEFGVPDRFRSTP